MLAAGLRREPRRRNQTQCSHGGKNDGDGEGVSPAQSRDCHKAKNALCRLIHFRADVDLSPRFIQEHFVSRVECTAHRLSMDALQVYEIELFIRLDYDSPQAGVSMARTIDWKGWLGLAVGMLALFGGTVWALASEFSKIDKHISRVETAVRIVGAKQGGDTKTLMDEALTVAKNTSEAGRAQSAKTLLDIANRLLAEQKASREPAKQEFFDSTIQKYHKLQKSPELADAAWEGSRKLVEYRSATSSVPPGMSVYIGELGHKGPFRYLKDSLISGPNAIRTGTEKGFVLDGFYLENVVFENANIIYNGGPVILQNVRFVNCTFDVRRSSQSEKLFEAAIK